MEPQKTVEVSLQNTSDVIMKELSFHTPEDQNKILSGLLNHIYEMRQKDFEAANAARNIAEVDLNTFIKMVTNNKS